MENEFVDDQFEGWRLFNAGDHIGLDELLDDTSVDLLLDFYLLAGEFEWAFNDVDDGYKFALVFSHDANEINTNFNPMEGELFNYKEEWHSKQSTLKAHLFSSVSLSLPVTLF